MLRKLFYLASFVLVLSMAGNTSADLVDWWRFDEEQGRDTDTMKIEARMSTLLWLEQEIYATLDSYRQTFPITGSLSTFVGFMAHAKKT